MLTRSSRWLAFHLQRVIHERGPRSQLKRKELLKERIPEGFHLKKKDRESLKTLVLKGEGKKDTGESSMEGSRDLK